MKTLPTLLQYLSFFCTAIYYVPAQAAPDAKPKAELPVVLGEPSTKRQVIDQEQGGIPVWAFMAPAMWKEKSQAKWTYSNICQRQLFFMVSDN
jgi:hypothetical protein